MGEMLEFVAHVTRVIFFDARSGLCMLGIQHSMENVPLTVKGKGNMFRRAHEAYTGVVGTPTRHPNPLRAEESPKAAVFFVFSTR